MIECPNCRLEYRGSIPNYCMECGTKLKLDVPTTILQEDETNDTTDR